ncbi:MAG: hypothetical protein AB7N71_14015 [Phycisphaerae bacterium]
MNNRRMTGAIAMVIAMIGTISASAETDQNVSSDQPSVVQCQQASCQHAEAEATDATEAGNQTYPCYAWRSVTHFGCGGTANYYVQIGCCNTLHCPYCGCWFNAPIYY